MPSPFPGMDPYLEGPGYWPAVHHAMAIEIRNALNRELPASYYADVEMRPELGIVADDGEEEPNKVIVPDVVLLKRPRPDGGGGVAVAGSKSRAVSKWVEFDALPREPSRHFYLEIREAKRGHKLITLIEILSPSNKRNGPDRIAYEAKQRQVLESDVNLIEIDLLRAGRRVFGSPALERAFSLLSPTPDYAVLVSPAWNRNGPHLGYIAYPWTIREPLPCIGVPLRVEEPFVALDLQDAFRLAYDGGPYRRGAVDYGQPPEAPLQGEDAAWALEQIAAG